jgi:hypothetical protein
MLCGIPAQPPMFSDLPHLTERRARLGLQLIGTVNLGFRSIVPSSIANDAAPLGFGSQ